MANLMLGRHRLGRFILGGHAGTGGGVNVISYPLLSGGFTVIVYNSTGQKIAMFGDHVGYNPLSEIYFEHVQTGCGSFSLTFNEIPDIALTYNHRIDIHLFGDSAPWYSGYITKIPKKGTTKTQYVYEGYGYYDHLSNVLVNERYESTEISQIVNDIMTIVVEPSTDIVYSSGQIYTTGYTATAIKYRYTTAKEAIEDLADYAGGYVAGVDERRRLYFKEVSEAINLYLVVGKHIHSFEPTESIEDLANHIFVKASSQYVTTLTSAVSDTSTTTLSVKSSGSIAAGDTLTIDDEDLYVYGVSGTTITVTRGHNSTTAATHSAGALVTNQYVTTLTSDVAIGATYVNLASGTWISEGNVLAIDDEKIYVKSVSGTTAYVRRGYNDTTAAAHSSGTKVTNSSYSSSATRILYERNDADSISTYGLRQTVLSLPSAMSEDDAQRWADHKLSKMKFPSVTASVDNVVLDGVLIKAEGKARVISEDGTVYDMAIVEAKYTISATNGIRCQLSLGSLPTDTLDSYISSMLRDNRTRDLMSDIKGGDD